MKILILSSNNGGGHNSAAKALLEEAKERNIECVMVDAMNGVRSQNSQGTRATRARFFSR